MKQNSANKVFSEQLSSSKIKQLKQASASCRAALQKAPNDPSYMQVLGLIECQLGKPTAAKEWFEKALAINPNSADMEVHYGLVLMELERYAEALSAFKRAAKIDPNHFDANFHLGNAHYANGNLSEASLVYKDLLKIKPDDPELLNCLGNIAADLGGPSEALDLYGQVLAINPKHIEAHNNRGIALVAMDSLDNAEKHFREAISLKADYAEGFSNLGNVFKLKAQFDESIPCYQKALAIQPHFPDALNNLASVTRDIGHLKEAIKLYRKSLNQKDTADHHRDLSFALLADGQFDEGWREYEWRWKTKALLPQLRSFGKPRWQGEALEGSTLLIYAEQGFGDSLQFCRYVRMVRERGLKVILEVQPELKSLLGSLEDIEKVVSKGDALPDFDFHIPMLSLPLLFETQANQIPNNVPYISADKKAIEIWKEKLGPPQKDLRVGLVWAGSSRLQSPDLIAIDRQRSIRPEQFAPLLELDNIEFFSLQKNGLAAPDHFKLKNHMSACETFSDTAALIENLDLIISVDTAVVHLAGALGKKVWMLNRMNSCWRWFLGRDDSPWYPNLKLFRQTKQGDFDSVILRIRDELKNLTAQKNLR